MVETQQVIKLELTEEEKQGLKQCPFCGSTNLELLNTWTACYWIECPCGVEVTGESYPMPHSLIDHELAKQSAIEKWNHRV